MSESAVCTFTIEITEIDEIPPEITEIKAIEITKNSVTITWKTNEPSTSQVELGPPTPFDNLINKGKLSTYYIYFSGSAWK